MNKEINRPLGTNEKVFWVLDQKNTTQFAVVAEINGNKSDNAWRQALDIVQQRHPNLSVQISGNEYLTAHLESVVDCRIPLRVVNTQSDWRWNSILEEELSKPLDVTIAPLVKAILIQQPEKSIFMFISNHSIGDGMSVALVIRDVLTVLSGSAIENMLPLSSLDELAGVSLKTIEKDKLSRVEQVKNSLRPRLTVNVECLKLSRALTKTLAERSRSESTTVHGALSAAIVLALQAKSDTSLQEPVRILHPLSARTTLSLGDDYGLLINIVTMPYQPSSKQTFWNFARTIRQGIAETQTPEWIKADTTVTQGLFGNEMHISAIEEALHQGTAHEIMLTNLGRLTFESDYGDLELKSIWGPMVLTPHALAQTVGVATLNGELTLSLTGVAPSCSLLQVVEEIIEKVCGTEQDLSVGNLTTMPAFDIQM